MNDPLLRKQLALLLVRYELATCFKLLLFIQWPCFFSGRSLQEVFIFRHCVSCRVFPRSGGLLICFTLTRNTRSRFFLYRRFLPCPRHLRRTILHRVHRPVGRVLYFIAVSYTHLDVYKRQAWRPYWAESVSNRARQSIHGAPQWCAARRRAVRLPAGYVQADR